MRAAAAKCAVNARDTAVSLLLSGQRGVDSKGYTDLGNALERFAYRRLISCLHFINIALLALICELPYPKLCYGIAPPDRECTDGTQFGATSETGA